MKSVADAVVEALIADLLEWVARREKSQRVRRAPPSRLGARSRRTPFCACSPKSYHEVLDASGRYVPDYRFGRTRSRSDYDGRAPMALDCQDYALWTGPAGSTEAIELSSEVFVKRLPIAVLPARTQAFPLTFGKSGVIENDKGSRSARDQFELDDGVDACGPVGGSPCLYDPPIWYQFNIAAFDAAPK